MEITLIYSSYNNMRSIRAEVPLGVAYIASSLRNVGYKVNFIDLRFDDIQLVEDIIDQTDIFGISSLTAMMDRAIEVLQRIKRKRPNVPVIIGGPHATLEFEDCLRKGFDYAVIGEGDRTICSLAKVIYDGGDISIVSDVAYRDSYGQICYKAGEKFIQNLDDVTFPSHDLINYEKYFDYFAGYEKIMPMPIVASRGCPGKCIYCQPTLQKLMGKKIRTRSPGNTAGEMRILDEIRMNLVKNYHRKIHDFYDLKFGFRDDTLTFNKTVWFEELKEELLKRNIQARWSCQGRADFINKEKLSKMYEAGLRHLSIGVESGSRKILDYYKKGVRLEQVEMVFAYAKELNITTTASIMLGAPVETKDDLKLTYKFLKKIKPTHIGLCLVHPLPGTALYEEVKREGIYNIPQESSYLYYDCTLYTILKEHTQDKGFIQYRKHMPINLKYLTYNEVEYWYTGLKRLDKMNRRIRKLKVALRNPVEMLYIIRRTFEILYTYIKRKFGRFSKQ